MIQRWERMFLEEGAEGLMKERRGRACKASGSNKGRPPKFDRKVEDLILENQRLRMEIEYLKKLKLEEYIHYYNNERISLKLKEMSPVQYRAHSQQT